MNPSSSCKTLKTNNFEQSNDNLGIYLELTSKVCDKKKGNLIILSNKSITIFQKEIMCI